MGIHNLQQPWERNCTDRAPKFGVQQGKKLQRNEEEEGEIYGGLGAWETEDEIYGGRGRAE